jgi:hypothetical protein
LYDQDISVEKERKEEKLGRGHRPLLLDSSAGQTTASARTIRVGKGPGELSPGCSKLNRLPYSSSSEICGHCVSGWATAYEGKRTISLNMNVYDIKAAPDILPRKTSADQQPTDDAVSDSHGT